MTTSVLVPGSCHGAWWFEPLARRLRERDRYASPNALAGAKIPLSAADAPSAG
ncbi:hypothetical protein [Streptomyces tateyamensis]|uniref:hypothetical protein n=1 Tax=Streptomyces tateyamensis TaxID=565073 RepID=UPI0015E8C5A2|nr:hypothetical protein [Streptomyces tateyamensis]